MLLILVVVGLPLGYCGFCVCEPPSFVFLGKESRYVKNILDKLCVCFCIERLSIGEVVLTWRWVSLSCYFGVYVAGLV